MVASLSGGGREGLSYEKKIQSALKICLGVFTQACQAKVEGWGGWEKLGMLSEVKTYLQYSLR